MNYKRLTVISSATAFVAAVCCFTPILVWIFSILGITALLVYLDFVPLPLLIISIALTALFYVKYKSSHRAKK